MSLKIDVHFLSGTSSHRILRKGKKPRHMKSSRLPRLTRLMALAIKYEAILDRGDVNGHQELADMAGVDRSYLSRILRLRLLSPYIQEWLTNLPENERGGNPLPWCELRKIASISSWETQADQLRQRCAEFNNHNQGENNE